jgi:hypothetical protein
VHTTELCTLAENPEYVTEYSECKLDTFQCSPSCRPTALCCHRTGCTIHIKRSWRLGNGVGNMQT